MVGLKGDDLVQRDAETETLREQHNCVAAPPDAADIPILLKSAAAGAEPRISAMATRFARQKTQNGPNLFGASFDISVIALRKRSRDER